MDYAGVHPGAILEQELLGPLGISPSTLARSIGVQNDLIGAIVAGKAGISEEIAALLATQLSTTSTFWVDLQRQYENRQKDLAELTAEAQTRLLID